MMRQELKIIDFCSFGWTTHIYDSIRRQAVSRN